MIDLRDVSEDARAVCELLEYFGWVVDYQCVEISASGELTKPVLTLKAIFDPQQDYDTL